MRERGTETRPEVTLSLDVRKPADAPEDFDRRFERSVREVASRAVAHVKRGDQVLLVTSAGGRVKVDRSAGIDPLLRFLALVEPVVDDGAKRADGEADTRPADSRATPTRIPSPAASGKPVATPA
jgi:uncharacterized protein (DUF58 family)